MKGKKMGGNLGGIMMMAIGMVFIAVGFIMFPNITTATDAILAYAYSSYSGITVDTYTGLRAVTGITPLLCLLGYLTIAVISGFLGYRVMQSGGSMVANPASFLMLGISLVFIAMALYIYPVLLDGVSGAVVMKGSQTNTESIFTAVGQTTGNTTLTYELWNSSTAEVTSISSNATETLTATSYNATDNHLLVSGMSANTTRTLTTVYNNATLIDGTSSYSGLYQILLLSPMLVLLGFLVSTILVGVFGLKTMVD